MKLPKELTTVTNLSKCMALIMFVTLPIVAFLLGMKYQTMLIEQVNLAPPLIISPTTAPVACTLDAKACPDGSFVGRIAPNCEFEKCPTAPQDKVFCGGIAGKICPVGSYCKYDGNYPDAGGTCMKTIEPKPTGM